jgi:nicotinamide phosphoribosyltransferase
MFERLAAKGFASTNIVLGVGSYSLQFVTRDTHGFAQKATYIEIEVNGVTEGIEIFKDPITDSGVKKSARGLIMVVKDAAGDYVIKDRSTWAEVNSDANELKVIFRDSVFYNQTTLTAIRERLAKL